MSDSSKETLVFVHGMCHGAWCWEEYFIPFFESKGHKCIAINLPGHEVAGSTKSINQLGLKDYVNHLSNVVEDLEEPLILIGHSMGGLIIQHYLRKRTCKKAILMSSVPPSGSLRANIRVLSSRPGAIKFLLQGKLLPIAKKYKSLMIGEFFDSELAETFLEKLCAESMKAYLQTLIPVFGLEHICNTPIFVIGGDKDQIFSIKDFKETAKKYNAQLEVISGAGHNLMLEPNYKVTLGRIEEWLKR